MPPSLRQGPCAAVLACLFACAPLGHRRASISASAWAEHEGPLGLAPQARTLPDGPNRSGPYASAGYVPRLWLWADEDPGEFDGGFELEGEPAPADGWTFEGGWQEEHLGVGVFLLGSDSHEETTREDVHTRAAFLEARWLFEEDSCLLRRFLTLGLGAGWAEVRFDGQLEDSAGTAAEIRLDAGIGFGEHLGLELGAGYLYWGLPGETIGHGAFGTLGVTLDP